MQRRFLDYLIIAFKGVAMGAADVVPGVSGGTIALITGIYEDLINSLKSFDKKALDWGQPHSIALIMCVCTHHMPIRSFSNTSATA